MIRTWNLKHAQIQMTPSPYSYHEKIGCFTISIHFQKTVGFRVPGTILFDAYVFFLELCGLGGVPPETPGDDNYIL